MAEIHNAFARCREVLLDRLKESAPARIQLLTGPLSPAHGFDILPDVFPRLFHQAIKQVPYHHAEKSLDGSRDEGRAELKKEEVDELVQGPGMARLHELGLDGVAWPLAATSEDLALLLAWESGADLIVAVGTHANLVEYLDKGRKGMASTFLVRLKVGPKLVDAKGVNKLYRASVSPSYLFMILIAAIIVVSTVILISPSARAFIELIVLRMRIMFGA